LAAEPDAYKGLGTALFFGIVIFLAYFVYLVFSPFLVPLAWAGVLVVVSYPVYERVAARFGSATGAIATTAAVTLILIVPSLFAMIAFARQGVEAAQAIQFQVAIGRFEWVNKLWLEIQQKFPTANLQDLGPSLRQYGEEAAAFVASRLGIILTHTAIFLFHLGVTILAMFYLYRDGASMVERLRILLPFKSDYRDRLLDETRNLIFASVTSSLVAAAVHAALGSLAFAIVGVKAPIFWGVMMGFLSFVPVVGSALIWVPISISLMVGGHLSRGVFLVIFCAVIVGLVDNIIRPWLISGRAQMGGLVVFISVLGGISAFGLLGVVLGPIVVAAAASLLDLYASESITKSTQLESE
jgi:predicted PurR-regulated permease PerM